MQSTKLKNGKLLVAEPSILNDRVFNRSIVFIAEHNFKKGTVGFILNKPTEYTLKSLVPDLNCDFRIYNGGPVNPENLYFIHKVPNIITGSIKVADNMFWGGDFEKLTEALKNKKIKHTDIRFFLGYSGWDNSQIKTELKNSSWSVIDNNYINILTLKDNEAWKNQLLEFGGKYALWANSPKNPNLN